MMYCRTTLLPVHVLAGLFVACIASCAVARDGARDGARERLDLDGTWDFATDPDNRGEAEKWHQPGAKLPAMPLPGYAPAANGKIRVPGIWDNQGYGAETEKLRHNFVGKGWYRREVQIPDGWAGKRLFLTITGASRYTKAWIDDNYLGEHIGFLSVQEYDITKYLAPGKTATITIQVDSKQRWEVDSLYGCCTLADYMDIAWGGIWGHVFLEARGNCWLSDLFLQPDLPGQGCSVSVTLNGMKDLSDAAQLEIFDAGGRRVAEVLQKLDPNVAPGQSIAIKASIPNPSLWTPDTPTLYTARLTLRKETDAVDAVESRFGMRQFTFDSYHLLLNGKRIMLCGYGDDHVYPEQMAMPSDKQLHLSRLKTIKSYGFNFVRHHSAVMPPEYYAACDEVGIISTAEFPICYYLHLPGFGEAWKANVPKGTDPGPALATYCREWTAVIRQYRNHPSIFHWTMGNELYEKPRPIADFAAIAKQEDPTRVFVDSDSVSGAPPDEKHDRETLPMHAFPLAEGTTPLENPGKFNTPPLKKPAIVHESGNCITFSRLDLPDQFQHNFKPFWLTAGKAKLEKLGLLQEANLWAEKSERLYALLHKYNLEGLRKNPYLSGYQWWLFQDYWTSSNGIVDHYFRPKAISKEEILKFNNPVVLLQDGLQRTYRGKQRLELKILLSNFSAEPLQGDWTWEVKVGDRSVARQQTPLKAAQGELVDLGPIGVELPETASPAKVTIAVEAVAGANKIDNDWSAMLYPADISPEKSRVPVFATESAVKPLANWGVRPIPTEGDLADRAVYLVDSIHDVRLVSALERGAAVVLLNNKKPLLPARQVTMSTSWWKGTHPGQANHTGTLVYDHPITRAMAPTGWCDEGWFHLIHGAWKFNLEAAPTRPAVIIRALPTLELVEDEAVLFEVGVGKGCLMVSGLNHQQAAGRPENDWFLARLVDYAATLPHPKTTWPSSFVLQEK